MNGLVWHVAFCDWPLACSSGFIPFVRGVTHLFSLPSNHVVWLRDISFIPSSSDARLAYFYFLASMDNALSQSLAWTCVSSSPGHRPRSGIAE